MHVLANFYPGCSGSSALVNPAINPAVNPEVNPGVKPRIRHQKTGSQAKLNLNGAAAITEDDQIR
jgi:hypothetical protein